MSDETASESSSIRPASLAYNPPGAVATLKQSYRGKLVFPEMEEFIKELNGESDRAAVILASSLLDDLLANAIARKMPFDLLLSDLEKIFRQSGPLGSFSARIEIACLFGIIDENTYKQLTILREMRNACAHSKHRIDFRSAVLLNVASHFFKHGSIPENIASKKPKIAFVVEISFLAMVLSHGSREEALRLRADALKAHIAALTASPPEAS